jgi:hypothetical protein
MRSLFAQTARKPPKITSGMPIAQAALRTANEKQYAVCQLSKDQKRKCTKLKNHAPKALHKVVPIFIKEFRTRPHELLTPENDERGDDGIQILVIYCQFVAN